MLRMFIVAISILVVGCTTPATTGNNGFTLIQESEYFTSLPEVKDGEEAYVVVKRDAGFAGSALRAVLYIDDLKVVNLRPGQFVRLKVSPGEHKLTLNSNGFALLPVGTKAQVDIKTGEEKYYRVKGIWGGGMQLFKMDENKT